MAGEVVDVKEQQLQKFQIDPFDHLESQLSLFSPEVRDQLQPILDQVRRCWGGDYVYLHRKPLRWRD